MTTYVSPGAWVRVPVPNDSWPVRLQIGDAPAAAAFIDHVRDGRGRVTTIAQRRCPNLRPGRYKVRAFTPDGVTEIQVTVV